MAGGSPVLAPGATAVIPCERHWQRDSRDPLPAARCPLPAGQRDCVIRCPLPAASCLLPEPPLFPPGDFHHTLLHFSAFPGFRVFPHQNDEIACLGTEGIRAAAEKFNALPLPARTADRSHPQQVPLFTSN